MEIKLSDHFTCKRLLLFAAPTIGTVVIAITYDVIDGYFVSNFIGKTAFAAVNVIYPFQLMLSVVGYMFGTGGSALIAAQQGKGDEEGANRFFTMIVKFALMTGAVMALLGCLFLPEIGALIGATPEIMEYGLPYGRTLFLFLPVMIVGYAFQSLLITAERPQFGLYLSVANMLSNIIFDYLFIVVLEGGMVGAAIATGIGACLNGLVPMCYFARPNSSSLRFVSCGMEIKPLLGACYNGLSEMVEDMSTSLIFVFYNYQLLRLAGENGVAAFGVVIFVEGFFTAVFCGLALQANSIVGYHFGAANFTELKSLLKKGIMLNLGFGLLMFVLARFSASVIAGLYVGYDAEVCAMAEEALQIYALAFILQGFNIYASAYFTGLNNGKISALIAFARTFLVQTAAIFLLPMLLGTAGLWLAQATAELVSALLAAALLYACRREYCGEG
ncbi:putative efflux protein, MATE family [Selenomonas ruminantium]|uniref:Putative efflux protein, MATE family n=1 Tax=Selenomonas ruminantium TaxID=971 RepID=A0A1M6R097_SELRU|nr:MATE family efflux transporter [Selenomonas ruminantium]SHK25915.1 putative efflux protein, MATE family [Selenomonas ruminantium]